jgi:ABC-2 type transport system ATP-binding protein
MATDVMISTSALSKRFGAVRALEKISFKVNRGEVVGFLGPNGAGKSTTMRILTCFISPSAGGAEVHGYDVFENPLEVRKAVGYLPQRAPLYSDMNVWEYLKFTAEVRGMDDATFKRRLRSVVEVCGVAQILNKDIGTLSHGYRQRVGLGQALLHDPPILILDEPTSDLDPNEKAEVLKYIKEIGKDRTVLLSTHNLAEVQEACARVIIISKGRIVADGPLDEIRARTGRVRYVVSVDEQHGEAGNRAPTATELQDELALLDGASDVSELPTDETAHKFGLVGPQDTDLRAELFRLMVAKNWTLLELRRDSRDEGLLDRGETIDQGEDEDEYDDEEEDEEEAEDGDDEDSDDEEDEDSDDDGDDEEEDDDEDEDEEKD